jgi:hypothetical protein
MEETIVPANDCDLIPLVTLKNYPKQSFCIVYFICDHLLTFRNVLVEYDTYVARQQYSADAIIGGS